MTFRKKKKYRYKISQDYMAVIARAGGLPSDISYQAVSTIYEHVKHLVGHDFSCAHIAEYRKVLPLLKLARDVN